MNTIHINNNIGNLAIFDVVIPWLLEISEIALCHRDLSASTKLCYLIHLMLVSVLHCFIKNHPILYFVNGNRDHAYWPFLIFL